MSPAIPQEAKARSFVSSDFLHVWTPTGIPSSSAREALNIWRTLTLTLPCRIVNNVLESEAMEKFSTLVEEATKIEESNRGIQHLNSYDD